VPSLIVLTSVAKFFDTPYPPLTTLFLPLLYFLKTPQTVTKIHFSNLSIPKISKHYPFPSFFS
jgi:hypothetical protein